MRQFFGFLKSLKSFWKLYRDYEYNGEALDFIIQNYEEVLKNRTKIMSKLTYYAKDVIRQLDEWYAERSD